MVMPFIEIGRTECEDNLVLAVLPFHCLLNVFVEKQIHQFDKSLGVVFLICKVEIMPSI